MSFKKILKKELKKYDYDETKVEILSLRRKQLISLRGIEKLTNLKEIDVACNNISDIKGIGLCHNLTKIILRNNKVSDISEIPKLKKLVKLHFNRNKITEIFHIKNLPALEYLSLTSNQLVLKDTDLTGLPSLIKLQLSRNKLTNDDLGCIKNVKASVRDLMISSNELDSLKVISELTQLTDLSIFNNHVTDCSGIEKLSKLESFVGTDNNIMSLKNFRNLQNLRKLSIGGNELTTLKYLKDLRNLEYIHANENDIKNMEGLDSLFEYKLHDVRLKQNPIDMIVENWRIYKLYSGNKKKKIHLDFKIIKDLSLHFNNLKNKPSGTGKKKIITSAIKNLSNFKISKEDEGKSLPEISPIDTIKGINVANSTSVKVLKICRIPLSELTLLYKIGEGSYGKCYLGIWDNPDEEDLVQLKKENGQENTSGALEVIIKELELDSCYDVEKVFYDIQQYINMGRKCNVLGFALPGSYKLFLVMKRLGFHVRNSIIPKLSMSLAKSKTKMVSSVCVEDEPLVGKIENK